MKDVAVAFAQALKVPLTPGSSLICKLGLGKSTYIIKLVDILKTYFPQWKEKINFAANPPGNIQDSLADISKVSSCLDFQPQ